MKQLGIPVPRSEIALSVEQAEEIVPKALQDYHKNIS